MIKKIIASVIIAFCAIPALAVTEKEMEEAKAITAQAYLRYANDGSGYLDDFRATSMAQLESKLKAKEKENLKAFRSVKIPGDYASWDKAKLLEFWGVTFFTSPNLAEKGKAARSRVKQRISAMTVGAPASKEQKLVEEPVAVTPVAEESKPVAASAVGDVSETPAKPAENGEQILEKQEEILADQNAIAQDAEERQYKKEESGTWIYVLVLVILIGVVIWLVVFAANMMKKQSEPLAREDASRQGDAAGNVNKENAELRKQYVSVKSAMEEYKSAFEELQAENKRLASEIKALKAQKTEMAAQSKPEPKPQAPARNSANVLYLGRVNGRGLFVRADRRLNPGNSIYRLETRDGLVGTFHVVDVPEVTGIALSNPVEYLSGGCSAIDIEDTEGANNIVTENAGTAMFENGAWKVLRKSRIRFE